MSLATADLGPPRTRRKGADKLIYDDAPLVPPPPISRPRRTDKYNHWLDTINRTEGGYEKFSRGYESFGLHAQPNGDVHYREWAPNAVTASLTGDFSALRSTPGSSAFREADESHPRRWMEPRESPDEEE